MGRKIAVLTNPESLLYKASQSCSYEWLSQHDDIARRDIFVDVLQKRAREAHGVYYLPVSFFFMFLYSVCGALHYDITNVFMVEGTIRAACDNALVEVDTIDDVWAWLQNDFTSMIFVQHDMYGDELPLEEWSRVFTYSQLQGDVRIRQRRDSSAAWGRTLAAPLDNYTAEMQEANEGFERAEVNGAVFNSLRRLDIMRMEYAEDLPGIGPDAERDPAYEFFLPSTLPLALIKAKLKYLEDREWIDPGTNSIELHAMILNADVGHPRLVRVLIQLSLSRGGGAWYRVAMQSMILTPFYGFVSLAADVVWLAFLIITMCLLLKDYWKAAINHELLGFCCKAIPASQLMAVLVGWMIVVLFFMLNFQFLPNVKEKLVDLRGHVRSMRTEMAAGNDLRSHVVRVQNSSGALLEYIESMEHLLIEFELVSSWYILILMVRFLIGTQSLPRLSLVINTIQSAGADLIHFLVLFFPTFMAYVISGSLLFGRRLEEFSTIKASIGTCFRILMENEFDWDRLSEEHFVTTAVWVWTYLIVVVLLMLNMVLAIILDTYSDVRQGIDSSNSIFTFFADGVRRIVKGTRWCTDAEIEAVLGEMHGSTTVRKGDLVELLPKMSASQANMLFTACRNETAFLLKSELRRSTFLRTVSGLKVSAEQLGRQSRRCTHAGRKVLRRHGKEVAVGRSGTGKTKTVSGKKDFVVPAQGRMDGTSRPIPGMGECPGGYNPPLLDPEASEFARGVYRSSAEVDRPEWLREIDKSMATQEDCMLGLEAQLKRMQWYVQHAAWQLALSGESGKALDIRIPYNVVREAPADTEDDSCTFKRVCSLPPSAAREHAYRGPSRLATGMEGGGDPLFYFVLDLNDVYNVTSIRVLNCSDDDCHVRSFEVSVMDTWPCDGQEEGDKIVGELCVQATDSASEKCMQKIQIDRRGRFLRFDMKTYGRVSCALSYIEVRGSPASMQGLRTFEAGSVAVL